MSETTGVKRRAFLKVLGASGAATAAVGCYQESVEKLIPYLASPDQTVPGVSNYYASTCRECATSCGIVAETRDGRAIKLEGNPEHPVNRGALCARGQSALQGLYNPDRYRGPMIRQNGKLVPTSWQNAMQTFTQRLTQARATAANVVFINQHETGAFATFLDEWLASLGMPPHIRYDAEARQAVAAANRQSFGGVAWPRLDFTAARLIVSFGADFLETWGASVPQQLSFADARAKLGDAPKVIYVGARRSLTGLNADEWIAAKPGSELAIANAILGVIGGGGDGTTLDQASTASGVTRATLEALAREIGSAKPAVALCGVSTGNAREVALACNAITQTAGGVGTVIRPAEQHLSMDGAESIDVVRDALQRMAAGSVPLVMVRGANPVYSVGTIANASAADAFAKAGFKVSFSSYPDETSELCDLVLPDNHSLESWGFVEPVPGTLSLQQPAMDPVFDTKSTGDVLLTAFKGNVAAVDYPSYVMQRFPGGQAAFATALPHGVTNGSLGRTAAPTRTVAAATPAAALEGQTGDYYLVVYPSATLGDGRGANKPWLQELPDPVTKLCWQSAVEMHPLTAKRLGIEPGDHVRVTTAAGNLEAPVYPYLGIRPDTIALALGQGHTAYGRYAKDIGVNALRLITFASDSGGGHALTTHKASLTRTGANSDLVSTEGSARQHGRGIGRALVAVPSPTGVTLREAHGAGLASELAAGAEPAEHEPAFPGDASHEFLPGLRSPVANDAQGDLGNPRSKEKGMYDPNHWSGMARRRWAMTVDLARCTGCSACVTACYAENNIPTVGARWQGRSLRPGSASDDSAWDTRPGANILKGREMSWIRIERYFEGGEDGGTEFDTRFVPMMCQHCGNAPCEPVCPVFATYHSPDGLNVQVYNRCVGTRYCSNGCPYKVRYFNWHGYGEPARRQYAFPEPLNWQLNPDVTVRGKGVMEKCSFCVQRIREAEHRASLEKREMRPDEFTTACAQGCPSRAITFGDAADDAWTVARQVHDERAYHVFEELNTFTAVVYLKKVNHPSASIAAAAPPVARPPSSADSARQPGGQR
jgi:anaerobic selenocysteine-containing dehydrogenase/Fe-S-cluster-containing dehydrogenase component